MLCQIKDINYLIFNKLEVRDLNNLSLASKSIKNLLDNNIFWMNKCVSKLKGKRFKFNEIKEIDWKRFYASRHLQILSEYLEGIEYPSPMIYFYKMKAKEEKLRELHTYLDTIFPQKDIKEKVISHLKDILFPDFYRFNKNSKRRFIVIRGKRNSGKSIFISLLESLFGGFGNVLDLQYNLSKRIVIKMDEEQLRYRRPHMDINELIGKLITGNTFIEYGLYGRQVKIIPNYKFLMVLNEDYGDRVPEGFEEYADYIDFNVNLRDSPYRDDTIDYKIPLLASTLKEMLLENLTF